MKTETNPQKSYTFPLNILFSITWKLNYIHVQSSVIVSIYMVLFYF
jgi:hypothetical protein